MRNNVHKNSAAAAILAATTAVSLGATWAGATTISLAGGTTSDGLNLTALNVVDAIYAPPTSTTSSETFQGVTFVPAFDQGSTYSASMAFLGTGTSGSESGSSLYLSPNGSASSNITSSFTDTSNPSANASLVSLLDNGLIYGGATYGATLVATVSGLTPNATYRVDFISSLGGFPNRSDYVYINGVQDTAPSDNPIVYASDPAYDTELSATANGSGVITVSMVADPGDPFFDAIVVSTPEPASLAMVGVASLGFLVRRRRAI